MHHALAWTLDHDPAAALGLALSLAPWWQLRGRLCGQALLLAAAAEHAQVGSDRWCAAQLTLAQVAEHAEDPPAMLERCTAVRDALDDPPGPATLSRRVLLSMSLVARASALLRMGRVAEAVADSRRAVRAAGEAGGGAMEAMALGCLSLAIAQDGDVDGALRLARRAPAFADGHAGLLRRGLGWVIAWVLTEAGDLAAAEQACTATLASSQEVGDQVNLCGALGHLTTLDLRPAASVRRRSTCASCSRPLPGRAGSLVHLALDCCGHLCSATGRPGDAVTAWAAMSALAGPWPPRLGGLTPSRRDMLRRQAVDLLGRPAARAAQERGAAMSLATATDYALLLAAQTSPTDDQATGLARLSPRERELVTLVARGRTDAQIAAELFITVRTVTSHLDRIRDKTGCRRRADLTRLALSAGRYDLHPRVMSPQCRGACPSPRACRR